MSRKHIDIDEPTPAPVFIRTILTGTLDVPFGGVKPQVRLTQTSAGYEVTFEAHGETRGRWFEHLRQAERYFERLTGRSGSFEYVTRRTIVRRVAGTALGVVAAALIGCVVSGSAFADCGYPPHNWVLLGLDNAVGGMFPIDMSKEPEAASECSKGLPAFTTKPQCEAALRRVIARYSGQTHADGNFGRYSCVNILTWREGG